MSRYDDLERLARLHSNGALSDEEFQREKTRLLAQPSGQIIPPEAPAAAEQTQQMHTAAGQNQNSGEKVTINVSPYSRLLALALCFFLGDFGVHRLYTGHRKTAIIMAILSLISFLSCAKLLGPGVDLSNFSPAGSGWEYFGEYTTENGHLVTTYSQKSASVFSTFLIAAIVGIWKFIDFVFIISGQFKDNKKRTLLRW